jgi:hypothetical protein
MTSNDVNWLRNLFRHDLPNTHIYSWDYHVNTQYLHSHVQRLVSDLCMIDRSCRCAVGAIVCTIVKADARADEQATKHLRTVPPGQCYYKECR